MSEYRLDRILSEHEVDQLRDLLVPSLKEDYPHFEEWLSKAVKEITEGTRVAWGIWKEKLIATTIVKHTSSNTAELKSFFIDPTFRNEGYGNSLYAEMENQCRKAGVIRIHTDVYCDNLAMVEFLISKGFLIAGKEDLYGNDRLSYIMSKTTDPEYYGDLFDWEELGEWFLTTRLKALKIENHPVVNERRFDRHMQVLLGELNLDFLVEIKDQRVDLDPVTILHRNCNESKYHIPVFIAREFTKRAREYINKNGILAFTARDIEKALGKHPPVFRDAPPAGMIVGIKPQYLEKILKAVPPVIYVKGGPFGKFLKKKDIIAFYSNQEQRIEALGEVFSTQIGSPVEIWENAKDKMAFTKEEYFRFSSMKKSILAIELNRIWRITPIEEDELKKIIPKKDRSGSYIDLSMVNRLMSQT